MPVLQHVAPDGVRRVGVGDRAVLGWREWVALPDFGVRTTKAKLDTGARTSSLHAFKLKRFTRDGVPMARRDEMGFRLLLGRQALRGRAVVDPQVSFRGGRNSIAGPKRAARAKARVASVQEDE